MAGPGVDARRRPSAGPVTRLAAAFASSVQRVFVNAGGGAISPDEPLLYENCGVPAHRPADPAGALTIIFETHSTSLDNEAGVASGHWDVDLSARGEREAVALGERRRPDRPDIVYASDLRRSWRTADIAFTGTGVEIVRDRRLRECDYGELTRRPAAAIDALRARAVTEPFPGGESYEQATARVAAWLEDVRRGSHGRVLVIGHRATHYALEHLVRGVPLMEAVTRPFEWQRGWIYGDQEGD